MSTGVGNVPLITLNDGNRIPQLGFGVFQIPPDETATAVRHACEAGYRHIDTAQMYGNEQGVGQGIRESGLDRSEVFVTSKLNNGFHRPDDARRAFDETLAELGSDYVDLFLIHWPLPTLYDGDFVSTWQTLEEFKADGRARSIGVSNFQIHHLQELARETATTPAVNQIEVHPYFANDAVRAYGERVGLRGTVLLAPEGINLFLSGQRRQLDEFLDWLGDHEPLLHGMSGKWSLSDSPAFARFKVKCKREIISFRDASCSPLTRSAEAIAPKTLRDWIRRGCDDEGKPLLLLDTRNREEVDWGTFRGAKVLDIDCFTDLPDAVAQRSAGWSGRRIVSFCTGGIRCEKAALWLADHGFDDVLQLQDGILGYFEQVGGEGFDGACFVFDERVALQADLTPVSPGAGMTDEPSTC